MLQNPEWCLDVAENSRKHHFDVEIKQESGWENVFAEF